jgi:hypothetical protein
MVARAILLVALTTFLLANVVRAQDAFQSRMTPAEAVSKADTVFIGKIADIGPDMRNETTPLSVTVNEFQTLPGKESPPIVLAIDTNGMRNSAGDMLHVGDSYIFFITRSDAKPNVFKLLPATDDNVALVKKLISN